MLTFTYIKSKIIDGDFMITETERLFLRELTKDDFSALYSVLADSDITQHYPYTFDKARVLNWIDKSIERYNIFGFGLWAVCLKDNIASAAVAVSYGCKKLDEFIDSENETTVVYGITRTEWEKIHLMYIEKYFIC